MRAAFKGGRPPSLGSLPTARSYNRLSAAGGGGLPTTAVGASGGKPPPLPGNGGAGAGAPASASPGRHAREAAARRRALGRAGGLAGVGLALLLLASLAWSPAPSPPPPSRLPPPAAGSGSATGGPAPAPLDGLAAIAAAADALAAAGHPPGAVRAAWRAAAAPGLPGGGGGGGGGGGIRDEAAAGRHPPASSWGVASAAAAAAAAASPSLRQRPGTPRPPPPPALASDVAALVAGLAAASGGARACAWDPTLNPASLIPPAARTLLAADARNLGPSLAPHWVLQAATLLSVLPAGGAFLSIYESGSSDGGRTGAWLGVARALAAALGAPARVITGGSLTRAPGTDRIAFLAAARNRALEPLWLEPGEPEGWDPAGAAVVVEEEAGAAADAAPATAAAGAPANGTASAAGAASTPPPRGGPRPLPPGPPSPLPPLLPATAAEEEAEGGGGGGTTGATRGWPATRVLFLNDVFFCAGDGVRLLAHTLGGGNATTPLATAPADVACGLDFDRPRLQDEGLEARARLFALAKQSSWPFLPRPLLRAAARAFPDALLRPWAAEGSPADAAYQEGAPLGFYDIWVGRDADGRRLSKSAPWAADPYSIARVASGLPFPSSCCWNGMVALPAAPFREGGLRMRAAAAGRGECAASECSLLCNDLLRLGAARFVIDPAVRVAYTPADAGDVDDPAFVPGTPPPLSWGAASAGPPLDWAAAAPRRPYWEACCLPPGADAIHWDADCGWDDWAAPDWTAVTRVPGRGVGSAAWGSDGGGSGVAAFSQPDAAAANASAAAAAASTERRQVLKQVEAVGV